MPLINPTYFLGEINLPQRANKFQVTDIERAIDIYEPEILTDLFGYELYNEVITAYNQSLEPVPIPLPPRFDKLINGADFSISFNNQVIKSRWIGLLNTDLISLIAYFVYFKYRAVNERKTSTTGEIKTKKENSENVDPRLQLNYAFNKMVFLYGVTPKPRAFGFRYQSLLDTYFLNPGNYRVFNPDPSAYNYLLANISDFPEWRFKTQYKIYFI